MQSRRNGTPPVVLPVGSEVCLVSAPGAGVTNQRREGDRIGPLVAGMRIWRGKAVSARGRNNGRNGRILIPAESDRKRHGPPVKQQRRGACGAAERLRGASNQHGPAR